MKTSIKLLDLIKQCRTMNTIRVQELNSTEDWETLYNLHYAYCKVVEEMFDIDCEVEYSELYRKVLEKFEGGW